MRNCLHDYPIKRLIHNLKQLKGGDCYSVFLTRFSPRQSFPPVWPQCLLTHKPNWISSFVWFFFPGHRHSKRLKEMLSLECFDFVIEGQFCHCKFSFLTAFTAVSPLLSSLATLWSHSGLNPSQEHLPPFTVLTLWPLVATVVLSCSRHIKSFLWFAFQLGYNAAKMKIGCSKDLCL